MGNEWVHSCGEKQEQHLWNCLSCHVSLLQRQIISYYIMYAILEIHFKTVLRDLLCSVRLSINNCYL